MKKLTVFLVMIFCLSLSGCSKDAEVNAFLTEFQSLTTEMATKLDSGGADEARKVFDAKKDGLKTKWEAIKNAREMQVSEETKKKMQTDMTDGMKKFTDAASKAIMKNPADATKIQAILTDLQGIIKM